MKPNQLIALLATLALAAGLTTRASASTIAYWKFEPGNFLADSSGNGHTLTAAPTTQLTTGGAGAGFEGAPTSVTSGLYSNPNNQTGSAGAAAFDGTQSLITVNTLGLNAYTQLTVEWFMKLDANPNTAEPWSSQNPADVNGVPGDFSIGSDGTFRDFGGHNEANATVTGVWHQYAITLNSTTGLIQYYRDYSLLSSSVSNGSGSGVASFLNTDFVLGKDFFPPDIGGQRHLQGSLDEFSVSSGILGPGTFLSEQLIPEPSTVMLLGVGGLMVWRRLKKS